MVRLPQWLEVCVVLAAYHSSDPDETLDQYFFKDSKNDWSCVNT